MAADAARDSFAWLRVPFLLCSAHSGNLRRLGEPDGSGASTCWYKCSPGIAGHERDLTAAAVAWARLAAVPVGGDSGPQAHAQLASITSQGQAWRRTGPRTCGRESHPRLRSRQAAFFASLALRRTSSMAADGSPRPIIVNDLPSNFALLIQNCDTFSTNAGSRSSRFFALA